MNSFPFLTSLLLAFLTTVHAAPVPKAQAVAAPRAFSTSLQTIHLEGVAFNSIAYQIRIADQPKGPASQWQNAREAANAFGALAAINASFFTPEGDALGLVRSNSKTYGTWNSATSLGNGIWLENSQHQSKIISRNALSLSQARQQPHLLQAGPMLVLAGRAQSLNRERYAIRSILLWDGANHWAFARSSSCTLQQIAQELAKFPKNLPFIPRYALNLDGGSSSELWISHAIAGRDSLHREFWNKPVRNFLILLPR